MIRHAQARKGEIKRVKKATIAKRIVFGLFGTTALTSFILFALDAYSANQAALRSTVQTNSTITDNAALTNETALHTKDENLSIGTSERHMLFQAQDASPSQTETAGLSVPEQTNPANEPQTQSDIASDSRQNTSDLSAKPNDSKSENASDHKKKQKSGKKSRQFCTVTEDYFSDALFIGDSRTVGMLQSHLLSNASYYAKTGIGIGDILSERIVNEGGRMISVRDALHLHSFNKVYIMIGINDIAGGGSDWFTQQYQDILDTIRQTQPKAVIYIQGNIPMSYGTQDFGGSLNNHNLSLRNEASRTLADKKSVFYLDIDKIYADENGNLQSCYTTDGLHVMPDYYTLWVDYLLHHAIVC